MDGSVLAQSRKSSERILFFVRSQTQSSNARFMVIVAAVSAMLIGCDGGSTISGVVIDQNARPIADAKVTISVIQESPSSNWDTTNAQGYFRVTLLHSPFAKGGSKITIQKKGYRTKSLSVMKNYSTNLTLRIQADDE